MKIKHYASGHWNIPSLPGQMFDTKEHLLKAAFLPGQEGKCRDCKQPLGEGSKRGMCKKCYDAAAKEYEDARTLTTAKVKEKKIPAKPGPATTISSEGNIAVGNVGGGCKECKPFKR